MEDTFFNELIFLYIFVHFDGATELNTKRFNS